MRPVKTCTYTILFLIALVGCKSGLGGVPSADVTDLISLALVLVPRDTSLSLYVRGAAAGTSAPGAALTLSVNDQKRTAVLAAPSVCTVFSEPFIHDFSFAFTRGLGPAVIRAKIAFDTPAATVDPERFVHVDSLGIVISVPDGSCLAPESTPQKGQIP